MAHLRFKERIPLGNVVRGMAAIIFGIVIGGAAMGQTGSTAGRPRGTEILFLGTAGGPPLRVERSEPATLLIVDGRPYLIDCGIGTVQRLLQAHIASEDIHTIFFTHLHADHDLGLADVMGNDFFRLNALRSQQTISIYGPPQTKDLVDAGLHYITFGFTAFAADYGAIRAGLVNGELKSPFVAHEIPHDGLAYQDDTIRVTAAENTHYALMQPEDRKRMKSYSYRIQTPHGVVVFTGDTGPSDAVTQLAKGADVLVSEVENLDEVAKIGARNPNHLPPEAMAAWMAHMRQEHMDQAQVGDMATKAQVKSVVLYHYTPANPTAYVAKVKEHFSGPVFAPADLDRYCLAPNGKSQSNSNVLSSCGNAATRK